MENHPPLTMPEAMATWQRRLPGLCTETLRFLRRAPLTRPDRKSRLLDNQDHSKLFRPTPNLTGARAALLSNEQLHEDIVQELWAEFLCNVEVGQIWAGNKIVENKKTGTREAVLHADCWLSRVHKRITRRHAQCEAKEYLPRQIRSVSIEDDENRNQATVEDVASTAPSPEEVAATREMVFALAPVLSNLSEEESRILLGHIEGLSHREVASELGIKEGAARTILHRIRRKLSPSVAE